MADTPPGYSPVPEADQKKAKSFFEHARIKSDTGAYDYAIDLYLSGLRLDPDAVDGHAALRDTSLRRKATGGKDLGMFEKMKIKSSSSKDEKENLLTAEKLLAFDPGNCDNMLRLLNSAFKAGYYDTVMWIGQILARASAESGKPDIKHYIALKDIYKALDQWTLAAEACSIAINLRPNDMDLVGELKNIGAHQTMVAGKYGSATSFRDSVKDAGKQQQLMEQDKDIRSEDGMSKLISVAKAEYEADPNDLGKIMKYVDALEKTESDKFENQAIAILEQAHRKTQNYRFKMRIGDIELRRLARQERDKKEKLAKDPTNAELKLDYREFLRDKAFFELNEYQERLEAYPTENKYRVAVGERLFTLQRYDEAIPILQQARNDPRYKTDGGILLARAFFEAGFNDEAADTLDELVTSYEGKGDARSKEVYYWRARALEKKGVVDQAMKHYSQVAQWDFAYRDVQQRLKALRNPTPAATPTATPASPPAPPPGS